MTRSSVAGRAGWRVRSVVPPSVRGTSERSVNKAPISRAWCAPSAGFENHSGYTDAQRKGETEMRTDPAGRPVKSRMGWVPYDQSPSRPSMVCEM